MMQPDTAWGLFELLTLLGSLALFLYGMKIMSEGLQQTAGKSLRRFLEMMTSNTFKGLLTGFGVTTLIQSSSVTSLMVVSFVNAGLLTLTQATGVIMGANIGTTATAWIIDILGFKTDLGAYMLVLLAIGTPLLFFKSNHIKGLGSALIGFALLFMGLEFLKDSVPVLDESSEIIQLFISINNIPYLNTVIFVFFGALLTVIIQSSSATIALTMTIMAGGMISFEMGAAMVLGENIGTTITAGIASLVGNVHARRTARIHSLFNLIGVVWVLLVFPYFINGVATLTEMISGGNPLINSKEFGSTGLAVLHTTFNLTNTALLIWFAPQLVRLSIRTVKSKGDKDEQYKLEYIGTHQKPMPNISVMEAKKELIKFGEIAGRMAEFTRTLIFENDKKAIRDITERIKKYEEITDVVEVEIASYLSRVLEYNKDSGMALRVSGMNKAAGDLERIGDLFFQISKTVEKGNEEKLRLSDLQNQRLNELLDLLDEAFVVMNENLAEHTALVTLDKAKAIEEKINAKRNEIRKEHYKLTPNLTAENMTTGFIYQNIFSSLERIGDHIINVTEGIMGKL